LGSVGHNFNVSFEISVLSVKSKLVTELGLKSDVFETVSESFPTFEDRLDIVIAQFGVGGIISDFASAVLLVHQHFDARVDSVGVGSEGEHNSTVVNDFIARVGVEDVPVHVSIPEVAGGSRASMTEGFLSEIDVRGVAGVDVFPDIVSLWKNLIGKFQIFLELVPSLLGN
jgi:hypothetical protein